MTTVPLPACATGLLIAASKNPDAKVTFVSAGGGDDPRALVVKVPSTVGAGRAVEDEARMLRDVAGLPLSDGLRATIPEVVRTLHWEGRPVLVTTAMPGRAMAVDYHQWRHTARASVVRSDLALAGSWLAGLQRETGWGRTPIAWGEATRDQARSRWDGDPALVAALERLEGAAARLDGRLASATVVHGDYWFGNVLTLRGRVSGVVDWEAAEPVGCPLRDLARFALSYALYLDRHARPGRPVLGHQGLRGGQGGLTWALLGRSWFAREVRQFLESGLRRLALPPTLWYDVALLGVGEVAAQANNADFAHDHLVLLAGLPPTHPGAA